jgi:hypothetical protein
VVLAPTRSSATVCVARSREFRLSLGWSLLARRPRSFAGLGRAQSATCLCQASTKSSPCAPYSRIVGWRLVDSGEGLGRSGIVFHCGRPLTKAPPRVWSKPRYFFSVLDPTRTTDYDRSKVSPHRRRSDADGHYTQRPLKHSHLKKHTAVARATAGKVLASRCARQGQSTRRGLSSPPMK